MLLVFCIMGKYVIIMMNVEHDIYLPFLTLRSLKLLHRNVTSSIIP